MNYISTRGGEMVTSPRAILQGLASDGGLFVPSVLPKLSTNPTNPISLASLSSLSYKELAFRIISLYFDEFDEAELKDAIDKAYSTFDTADVAPTVKKGEYFCELFHGKTLAFKDVALSLLPYLLKMSIKLCGVDKDVLILTATSGDTGKAALEAFCDVEGTRVCVYYPSDGVSDIQRLQMVTQEGSNTSVIGIKGNFDEAQSGVKKMFRDSSLNDKLFDMGIILSSANSINVGRLVPQIVYYFYSYFSMLKNEDLPVGTAVNFSVPTGNFGNILAGFYAKEMGLPINKLICASNDNKVLYDFFNTKVYDINRAFVTTVSPSMDILISSNLERLLYSGNLDFEKTKSLMNSLSAQGRYTYDAALADFVGEFATETQTLDTIREHFNKTGYCIDTHTAVALYAYQNYKKQTGDETRTIILSTASPYKFAKTVVAALGQNNTLGNTTDSDSLSALSEITKTPIPEQISNISKKPILHKAVCKKEEMEKELLNTLLTMG